MKRPVACLVLTLLAAIPVAACGSDPGEQGSNQPAPTTTTAAPAAAPATAVPAADPYEAYLKLAPSDAPALSRDDAQTRALLGCGQKYAPGTVDAALAEAYADLCSSQK